MQEELIKTFSETNVFRPISSLIGKSFSVKDYQRGYKWDDTQILDLLKDIYDHDPETGKYCLQPLIVRQHESNNEIELIDGQQRITSIYLILVYLRNTNQGVFDISYETRPESKEFLSSKITSLNHYAKLDLTWENFIKLDDFNKHNNVDVYHFYTVYKTIFKWFETHKNTQIKEIFEKKLLNIVHVIWYDIDQSSISEKKNISAENVFLNLNAGKITLSSSELIKAFFILESQENNTREIAKLKSTELALEWDQIENKLQDNSFWFFICDNEKYNSIDTRIDFLIDIVNKRDIKKHDDLYSYRIYEERFRKQPLQWVEIKKTFSKLVEWYDDKEIYHYVGFLIVSGIKNLSQILAKSTGLTKSEFKDELIVFIKTELKKIKKNKNNQDCLAYGLDEVNYEDSRKECERLLVLLNILYYVNNLSMNKFPFELYKVEKWSVEHINPQNPRDFENIGEIKEWLNTYKNYYQKTDPENKVIIASLDEVINIFNQNEIENNKKLKDLKLDKLEIDKFDGLVELIRSNLELHQISNLALLDRNANSKLSNKSFLDKRELILDFDQTGRYINTEGKEKLVFIPVCTKNVFSKIYSKDKTSIIGSFFGKKDMDSYFTFIGSQLNSFYN